MKADNQTRTAADPLSDDLRNALIKIRADDAHQFEPSFVFLVGRLVGVKMGSGRPPTPMCLWVCEPVD